MLEMKWDMWVMGKTLTNQSGLWWVPWFPYNGDQWWSRNSPSVPTESSLPMPCSSGTFLSSSSTSMGSFVWRESTHNHHQFVGAHHDLSRPYPSLEDVYLRFNQMSIELWTNTVRTMVFTPNFSLLFCLTHFTFVNFSYVSCHWTTNLFSYLPLS